MADPPDIRPLLEQRLRDVAPDMPEWQIKELLDIADAEGHRLREGYLAGHPDAHELIVEEEPE